MKKSSPLVLSEGMEVDVATTLQRIQKLKELELKYEYMAEDQEIDLGEVSRTLRILIKKGTYQRRFRSIFDVDNSED